MNYILDKTKYAEWFEQQFGHIPLGELTFPSAFVVVKIESPSKLSTAETEVVHVQSVEGSVGVLPGTAFVTAKRCLKPIYSEDIPW